MGQKLFDKYLFKLPIFLIEQTTSKKNSSGPVDQNVSLDMTSYTRIIPRSIPASHVPTEREDLRANLEFIAISGHVFSRFGSLSGNGIPGQNPQNPKPSHLGQGETQPS